MTLRAGTVSVRAPSLECMNDAVVQRMLELAPIGQALCRALAAQQRKLGHSGAAPLYEAAWFELHKDAYDGEPSLVGSWRNGAGHRVGGLVIHSDGSSFAEYDLLIPHPHDPRWFVEAVTAWGKGLAIKAEPRLLPVPE